MTTINLRQAKKQRDRVRKSELGTQNAVKFGRRKSQKEAEKSDSDKVRVHLDQHKLEK